MIFEQYILRSDILPLLHVLLHSRKSCIVVYVMFRRTLLSSVIRAKVDNYYIVQCTMINTGGPRSSTSPTVLTKLLSRR